MDDHDLYSFDASALGKFLGDRKVSLISHRAVNGSKLVRRHGLSLWSVEKPCDTDFLHQLEEPIQLKMERASQKVEAIPREIAPLQCEALPNWITVELTPEQVLSAMGVGVARVTKILKDMSDFHAAVDESERHQGTK